ncbi:cytochrome P460 family protein [Rhodovibrionaceae bacterium A322]
MDTPQRFPYPTDHSRTPAPSPGGISCRQKSLVGSLRLALLTLLFMGTLTLLFLAPPALLAQDGADSKTLLDGHPSVENPALLKGLDAEMLYQKLLPAMTQGYGLSELSVSTDYKSWQRYNSAPYRSAQHGRRFVNNYANDVASDYGLFEELEQLPPGSILAKDSFTVTDEGQVFSGPLFLMEKMEPGFHPPSGDWRYSMIMPDGSLLGETLGLGAAQVAFCIDCHALVARQDHLFFLPEIHRLPQQEENF